MKLNSSFTLGPTSPLLYFLAASADTKILWNKVNTAVQHMGKNKDSMLQHQG